MTSGYRVVVTSATELTMYSTVWCGYCQRLKAQMTREGISFVEVDIEADPQAAAMVEDVNHGNQTVPTAPVPRRLLRDEPVHRAGQGAPRPLTPPAER